MSQENLEILRLVYEADLDSQDVLQYLDPNVELYPGIDAPDQHMKYVGRDDRARPDRYVPRSRRIRAIRSRCSESRSKSGLASG